MKMSQISEKWRKIWQILAKNWEKWRKIWEILAKIRKKWRKILEKWPKVNKKQIVSICKMSWLKVETCIDPNFRPDPGRLQLMEDLF